MLGLCAGWRGVCGLGSLGEVDLAAENSVVFDGETESAHIPFNDAASPELDATACDDIALHLPLNENVPGCEVSGYVCARPDREPAFGQGHGSLNTTVNNQIFSALNFATNDNGFANPSRTIFGCHGSISFQNHEIS
jgi:hypothetical protein